MDYQDVTCILGLTSVVCYGFIIIALAFFWPNEANVYLIVFCIANGILAIVGAFEITQPDYHCHWNGVLRMFSLTLGFEMLRRNQIERSRMSVCNFRLYNKRPLYAQLLRSCIMSCIAAFAPWSFYGYNPAFNTCFIKATGSAQLEETMVSFFWFLLSFLRPVALTARWIPRVVYQSIKQIRVLHHERQLDLYAKLLLFKDHHRRLFHVITSVGSEILFILWTLLTIPYVLQVVGAVAGLSAFMRLEGMPALQLIMFNLASRFVPIASSVIFVLIYVTYFSVRLKI